ncbi:cadherin-like domain-containing protein, partial [Legionella sp. CNM-4043-24]|uniref:cadherin-like domain-containing protein n=1 Tax=Legionella sp. CNM-4043-24 TaxID=3421646 RepID=UPI00403B1D3C
AIAEDSGARVITQAELLANASDVDAGSSLEALNLSIASGAGSLVDNLDGTWTYTPALNDESSVSFNFDISDGSASVA